MPGRSGCCGILLKKDDPETDSIRIRRLRSFLREGFFHAEPIVRKYNGKGENLIRKRIHAEKNKK